MGKIGTISLAQDAKRKKAGFASWRVNIPANLSATGKRQKFFFHSRKEAAQKARELQIMINNEGARVFEITAPEIEEYFRAKNRIAGHGMEFRTGIDLLVNLLESGLGGEEIKESFETGRIVLERKKNTLSFEEAAAEMIDLKQRILKRRPSTIHQISVMVNQVKRKSIWFRALPLSEITADDCRKMLSESFNTPKQRDDARRILSGVFSLGKKRDWCEHNPLSKIEKEIIEEREIYPLTVNEVRYLFLACEKPVSKEDEKKRIDFSECVPALAILVFGGVRPEEVRRLMWRDVDFEEGVISIKKRVSKTGGTRHVTMCAVMRAWLEPQRQNGDAPICPPGWRNKWSGIRKAAGWGAGGKVWQEDALRHTFASYHAKMYKDFPLLQMEMGHGSAVLLQQRYTNLIGVTEAEARKFWELTPKKVFAKKNNFFSFPC